MAPCWFVYVVECADGTLYTGCTTDVERRIREHNGSPRGAKYTRSRRPVVLHLVTTWPTRSAACKEEARIKGLTRRQKDALIRELRPAADDK